MKKPLFAGIAAATFCAATVFAADMPVKAPPVPAPVFDWNGFYIGGNAGVGWTKADVATTNAPGSPGIFGLAGNIASVNAAGTGLLDHGALFTGGGQIGVNWQFSRNGLLGLEADINSFSQTKSLSNVAATTVGALAVANSLKTDWLATFRARAGFIANDCLVYVTGGLALTDEKFTQSFGPSSLGGPIAAGASTASSTKAGWTAGLGAERKFGPWSVKAEWLYVHFNGVSTNTTIVLPPTINTQLATGSVNHLNENIIRVGLNYHFATGGDPWGKAPVVAKY